MMIENLRSLAILTTVVEEGSFRAAGEKLGLSASVVSHHMTNLERRLDCPIFIRVSRRLRLTPKGEVLHRAARQMVDVIGAGLREISQEETETGGVLRLAIPQVLMYGRFLQAIESFLASYPKVNLKLEQCHPEMEPLAGGYDLAFTRQFPTAKALEWQRLNEIEFGFFAAPDLVARFTDLNLAQTIAQVPFICAPGFDHEDWIKTFSPALSEGLAKLDFRMECDDMAVAHRFACSGAGMVALPVALANGDTKTGRLEQVFTDLTMPSPAYYAVYPKKGAQDSLASRFLEHLKLDNVLYDGRLSEPL